MVLRCFPFPGSCRFLESQLPIKFDHMPSVLAVWIIQLMYESGWKHRDCVVVIPELIKALQTSIFRSLDIASLTEEKI